MEQMERMLGNVGSDGQNLQITLTLTLTLTLSLSPHLHPQPEPQPEPEPEPEQVGQDESNLQMKIDKKKTELDRHHKRLQSLQTVRPQSVGR